MPVSAPRAAFLVLLAAACCYTPPRVRPGRTGRHVASAPGYNKPAIGNRKVEAPLVRVRLVGATGAARVTPDKEATLFVSGQGVKVGAGQSVTLELSDDLLVRFGTREWKRVSDTVRLRAAEGGRIAVGERRYRGDIIAFVTPEQDLALVNELELDDYLCGVVPSEIGPIRNETYEAVKAQAVAARSFTLTRLGRRKGLGFQLYDTYARDQEYQGAGRETELSTRAVFETRGMVLLDKGEPAEALYHACCGGVTADGAQPYIRSVRDTPGHRAGTAYCAESKRFLWQASFGRREFEEKLAGLVKAKTRLKVKSVTVERDGSGRARYLRFATESGTHRVAGTDLRFALGLSSTLFEITLGRDSVRFAGKGWGHGCGLCQHGAVEMARRGRNHREILAHYYPELKLGRRY